MNQVNTGFCLMAMSRQSTNVKIAERKLINEPSVKKWRDKMSFLQSIFQAYVGSDYGKEKTREKAFKELESFPMLHSSNYLNNLTDITKTKAEDDLILDHLYKHDTLDIDSYKDVEQKIIDKRWK